MALRVWQATIVLSNGDVVPDADISVTLESTGDTATIYSDRTGTNPLSPPHQADANGFFQFYAAPGNYEITASDSGTGFSRTWSYVALDGDAADYDVTASATDQTDDRILRTNNAKNASRLNDGSIFGVPDFYLKDSLRASVETATGGRCTVIYTAKGQPSYMHVFPIFNCEDIPGLPGTGPHPAFLVNGVRQQEIMVGMYQASEHNGEALSLPGQQVRYSINYDAAWALCQANGTGHDLMTIWDWAAISLWCTANGYEPLGNTSYGRHHDERHQTGRRHDGGIPGDSAGIGNILSGSGPNEWRHDASPAGISDMVGNVWEWLSGMKMVDGRVFLSPDNDIVAEGSYTDTGFDLPSNRTWSTVDNTGASNSLLQSLIVPKGTDDPIGYLYTTLTGERLPFRGGARNGGSTAGLGALYLTYERTGSFSTIGFRPRFRN